MIKIYSTALLLLFTCCVSAQEKDSEFKLKATEGLRAEFPRFRPLNFEFGNSFARDYDSQLFEEDFQEGRIEGQRSFKAGINMPILKTQKWVLTGALDYAYNEFHFAQLENISFTDNFLQVHPSDFHNFRTALSSTYFSSLFKKPVIYNASIIADGNDKGLERFKGLVGASFIMKRTERTTITLGAIVFIDPTAQIPFFPTFTYNHKFLNSEWVFDFIMPQRVILRRPVAKQGRLSLGSTFGGNGFYVNVNSPTLGDVYEYSQLEVNTGLIYEHKVSERIVATFRGGMTNFLSSRLTQKGEPSKDFIYRNSQGATGYFNLGFSYNPFAN